MIRNTIYYKATLANRIQHGQNTDAYQFQVDLDKIGTIIFKHHNIW